MAYYSRKQLTLNYAVRDYILTGLCKHIAYTAPSGEPTTYYLFQEFHSYTYDDDDDKWGPHMGELR